MRIKIVLASALAVVSLCLTAIADPTKVFDPATGNVVGETNSATTGCNLLSNGNVVCPGYPTPNVQQCLAIANYVTDDGSTLCDGDWMCLVDTTQECLELFGTTSIAQAGLTPNGDCPIADAWEQRIRRMVENCPFEHIILSSCSTGLLRSVTWRYDPDPSGEDNFATGDFNVHINHASNGGTLGIDFIFERTLDGQVARIFSGDSTSLYATFCE